VESAAAYLVLVAVGILDTWLLYRFFSQHGPGSSVVNVGQYSVAGGSKDPPLQEEDYVPDIHSGSLDPPQTIERPQVS
jgi:hypothetical protein